MAKFVTLPYTDPFDLDDHCRKMGYPFCGVKLGGNLTWEDAKAELESDDEYIGVAMRFANLKDVPPTAKMAETEKRIRELKKELDEIESDVYYSHVSRKLVTCKGCGSGIAVAYLKSNACPACGADMRPPSEKERAQRKKRLIGEARKRWEADAKKRLCFAQPYWLVRVE